MYLVCRKHLIISLQIASPPTDLPFFKCLEALVISMLLIPSSNISLEVVKSFAAFALFITLSIILSVCSAFWATPAILKGLCYLSGFHLCVFLASLPFPKMSWGHYSQIGLSSAHGLMKRMLFIFDQMLIVPVELMVLPSHNRVFGISLEGFADVKTSFLAVS